MDSKNLPEPLWLLEQYRAVTLRMIYSGEVQMASEDQDYLENLGRLARTNIRRHKQKAKQ